MKSWGDKSAVIAALVPRISAACCNFRGDFCFTITLLVIVRRQVLTLTDGLPFQHTRTHASTQTQRVDELCIGALETN